ncbi:MAG TPA: acyl-CoA dehydrogenase family protein [Anaerolineae bacterium]|jgi:alkylation response protein AidB-like acyl-CoA dehydrogenase
MDFALNPEQTMWQNVVRDFCQNELKPRAAQTDHEGKLPMDVIKKMAPLGLLSLAVPEQDGGPGLDTVSAAIAIEEIGRACGSTALSVAAHNGLCVAPLVNFGTPAQKDRFLPVLTSGDYLGALALTEPGAGSDLTGGVQTTASLDGDEWVINGSKAWITNPSVAPLIITLCRSEAGEGSGGFNHLIVPTDTPGLTINPPEKKMGLKGSPTHMLSFDNVRVPRENLLGEPGRGLHQALATLDGGRITIGAMAVGLAQAALDEGVSYAQERETFGRPIAQHQAIQWMIADTSTEIEAARLLVYQAAWLKDQGKDFKKQAAMAKLFASETAERAAFKAIQIHGGYGYSAEFPVERIYRDQRLLTIGEGTSEILRIVISRRVLGA